MTVASLLSCSHGLAGETPVAPADMPRICEIDERFQSFNVEMVEVTGGQFWKPYAAKDRPRRRSHTAKPATAGRADLLASRSPIDLSNPRLRRFASALSPALLRVSGTWANSTFFAGSRNTRLNPPTGFQGILTNRQWRSVIDFSRAIDAPIVTSFAVSPGTRDTKGNWNPDQALQLLLATRSNGGRIAAAEFMNEPDLIEISGAPAGYDVAAFARDFGVFHDFIRRASPGIMILGPGTAGISSQASELFGAVAHGIDAVSYHFYGALSERCGGGLGADAALSEEWLSRTDQAFAFYRELRDRVTPGKPIWLTETAEAACGGNRRSSTFLDTFRYLDQLGRLAKAGVQVVMHNTLAASDYGLLDEATRLPRPNFWGAVLWRRLMGTVVLDSGVPSQPGLHVYAHCQRRQPGGVAMLVINNDPKAVRELILPGVSMRYTLDAAKLQDSAVRLNGVRLAAGPHGRLPELAGMLTMRGAVAFAPATITFLTIADAGNHNCQ